MTDFLETHGLLGITIGLCTFLIIGLFHPLVIKGEYYIGQRCNWLFLLGGIICTIATFMTSSVFWSAVLGVTACSCFWSILEVKQQRERVRKGWYPKRETKKQQEKV